MKAKHTVTPVDVAIPFDNGGTSFVSDNVHDAIIESGVQAVGLPRAGIALTCNGTLSTGAWITYSELLASPRILFPLKVRLKEMTWVNSNVNIRPLNFKFYKNGQLVGNVVSTVTPAAEERTNGYGFYVWPTDIDFDAGDSLFVQVNYTSGGTSLSDLALVIWIARVP